MVWHFQMVINKIWQTVEAIFLNGIRLLMVQWVSSGKKYVLAAGVSSIYSKRQCRRKNIIG